MLWAPLTDQNNTEKIGKDKKTQLTQWCRYVIGLLKSGILILSSIAQITCARFPHTWQQTIGYNCAKAKMLVFLFLLLLYRNFFPYFKLIFSTCFLTASLKGKYVFILIRKILLLACIPITPTSTSITVIVTYGIFFFPAH